MLNTPIKTLPRILIYKSSKAASVLGWSNYKPAKPYLYRMVDTKSGKFVGEMIGAPVLHNNKKAKQIFYPKNSPYKSFYIGYLSIEERFMGYGKEFIRFAKNLSKQSGCKGRVHLIASRVYDRYWPPHVFYKKCGFLSNDSFMNHYLDDCIKSNTQIESSIADNLNMYLPVGDVPEKIQTKFQAFLNFLKRFI